MEIGRAFGLTTIEEKGLAGVGQVLQWDCDWIDGQLGRVLSRLSLTEPSRPGNDVVI
jgi:hypothetical protein